MKKTIIALSLASVFAAPAMAQSFSYDKESVEKSVAEYAKAHNLNIVNGEDYGIVEDKTGHVIGELTVDDNGVVQFTKFKDHDRNDGKPLEVDTVIEFKPTDNNRVDVTVDDGSNWKPNNDVIVEDTTPDVVKPIHIENEEAEKIIDDAANAISKEVDKRIGTAGAAAYNEASAYATATDAKLANHESRIGSLEKDMQAMGNKMLVLEDRMDGVVASSHAITNARPVLNSAGQFGMGVGMGAAGSKQAIAIGGAYQISDNWSGTMSVNYETKGKVSNDQLSAGVGAQYIF
ncbi:hypothetical protein BH581_08330 [Vibrio splendidus]|uniref:YadA C-terminal domain-containing protein n=1 Tax=Vibrio splendidus TaxID=29497 RepID=UPI000978C688|nr:YadA C-terminal domain-containing protein [Vibrio splendidus]OMO29578.1 hypothetical protein BH581_08330 [Vibrio splendidus]